jgi:hypothetical protein
MLIVGRNTDRKVIVSFLQEGKWAKNWENTTNVPFGETTWGKLLTFYFENYALQCPKYLYNSV